MARLFATLQLMLNSLLPPVGRRPGEQASAPLQELTTGDGARRCSPQEFRRGVEPLLDDSGRLRLFFPGCLAIAAPLVLFRLKRQGFSRCSVQASEQGLYVTGMR